MHLKKGEIEDALIDRISSIVLSLVNLMYKSTAIINAKTHVEQFRVRSITVEFRFFLSSKHNNGIIRKDNFIAIATAQISLIIMMGSA